MVEIEIDGHTYQVREGASLLPTCLELGLRLPYFCWHPALGSVGACRQCAVVQYKDAEDVRGRLVMACMTPVRQGLRIGLEHPEAERFRASIIECLMTNHPHDCPVCEEGGECHLQDMTVMTGHVRRRYRGFKRTHRNQHLGPFINHEMNRCIACYRCLRFYRDYAGGTDLQVFSSGRRVYFGRHRDGPLENEFSGNLVEVCPTGVFTDRTFSAHYARKWDQEYAPGICPHCAVGCNLSLGMRAGVVRRVINRFHPKINGHFLCDRGRFGYDAVNDRLVRPRFEGETGVSGAALDILRGWRKEGPLIGIGSPRASLESNYALRRLVGKENFHLSPTASDRQLLDRALALLMRPEVRVPAPLECEECDTILVLGEDVTQTAPRVALALRQAVQRHARDRAEALGGQPWQAGVVKQTDIGLRHPLFLVVPHATHLDSVAHYCHYAPIGEMARLGFEIARAVEKGADVRVTPASDIAATLLKAERPLIVCGTSCRCPELLEAAESLSVALARRRGSAVDLLCIVPECNSLGVALLGGGTLEQALEKVERGEVSGIIVLEDDLYQRASASRLDSVLNRLDRLAVIDAWNHRTAQRAKLFLPAAPWSESAGTWVNLELRAQRSFAVQPPQGSSRAAWRWIGAAGAGEWPDLEALFDDFLQNYPQLKPIQALTPDPSGPVPRQPHRFSGRTALNAPRQMHEPKAPPDPDSPLVYSMEGLPFHLQPPGLQPFYWQPGWDSHSGALNANPRQPDRGVRLASSMEPGDWPIGLSATESPGGEKTGRYRRGYWQVVPRYHIFGSEFISARAPAIVQRTPGPYVALGPEDVVKLGLRSGALLRVHWDDEELVLPLIVEPGLSPGVAALPWGLVPWFPADGEIGLQPLEKGE